MNVHGNMEQLFDQYAEMIIRIAFQIVKNQSDAEDVCQEVFLKLMQNKKAFDTMQHPFMIKNFNVGIEGT